MGPENTHSFKSDRVNIYYNHIKFTSLNPTLIYLIINCPLFFLFYFFKKKIINKLPIINYMGTSKWFIENMLI